MPTWEVYHYIRDTRFLIKAPGSWWEVYARGQKFFWLGSAATETPERLGVREEWRREIVVACSQRLVTWGINDCACYQDKLRTYRANDARRKKLIASLAHK